MYGMEGGEEVIRLLVAHGARIEDVEDVKVREGLRRLIKGAK